MVKIFRFEYSKITIIDFIPLTQLLRSFAVLPTTRISEVTAPGIVFETVFIPCRASPIA